MKYSDARPLLKTGDLLFWRDSGVGSIRAIIERWLIRHGTGSPYIHVGIVWIEHDRVWLMDITTRGCAPRLLSENCPFEWAQAPRQLSETALRFAFDKFGYLTYSRWQAILGMLRRLRIGADDRGQCAEFVLSVLNVDGMAPTMTATPAACADGVTSVWGVPLIPVNL